LAELWVRIADFPRYSVSSLGRVRRDANDRLIQPQINQFDVPYVGLMREGWQYNRSLPLIVATAFVPKPELYDTFDTPISLDGDRTNCRADNLMWRPRWFAIQYHQQFKFPPTRPLEAPLRDLGTDEVYQGSFDAAVRHGLLERDLVESIEKRTYVWPTYQMFDVA
jgi:NUMOD4 motif